MCDLITCVATVIAIGLFQMLVLNPIKAATVETQNTLKVVFLAAQAQQSSGINIRHLGKRC